MSFMLRKSQDTPNPTRPTPSRVQPASIVAVASGKGGVGKTFSSITLAGAFAMLGKRTLLVDGDLGLANVDVQLGKNGHTGELPERYKVNLNHGSVVLMLPHMQELWQHKIPKHSAPCGRRISLTFRCLLS